MGGRRTRCGRSVAAGCAPGNEEYEALLAEARDAATLETAGEVLARAQAIIAEQDPPSICYAQPKWVTALNRRVEGFVFNPIYIGSYDLHKLSKR